MTTKALMSALQSYYTYLRSDVQEMILVMNPDDAELKHSIARFMECVEDNDCKTEPMESVLVLSLISMYQLDKRMENESSKMRKFCKRMYKAHNN